MSVLRIHTLVHRLSHMTQQMQTTMHICFNVQCILNFTFTKAKNTQKASNEKCIIKIMKNDIINIKV